MLKRAGFDPRSHAGKALMDTLENFPRDELFHTPLDELAPTAVAVMHARERRQVKIFIRQDTYGRYVTALVYLPRDRYNTAVRERFARILKEELGGDSVEFSVRMGESATANVHFVVHPPQGGSIREVDTAELERRLADASRSWRDDFVSAAMAEYGDDRGAAPRAHLRRLVPRGLQGGLQPRRSGPPTSGSLDRLGDEGIDLRLYGDGRAAAAKGGSRSSAPARRCRCRRCCRCCRRWAWRSSTSGPTS